MIKNEIKREEDDLKMTYLTNFLIAVVDELPLEQTDDQCLDVGGDSSDDVHSSVALLDVEEVQVDHQCYIRNVTQIYREVNEHMYLQGQFGGRSPLSSTAVDEEYSQDPPQTPESPPIQTYITHVTCYIIYIMKPQTGPYIQQESPLLCS
jgi:hypothetical protein